MNPKDWIAGLERGLGVLECFGEEASRLSAQQVALRTGLTRTAARRQLLTLAHVGYLATDGKLYWLTPRVLRLAQAFIDSSRLARIVLPYLQRIANNLQQSAYLSVLDGFDVIYLTRQGPSRSNNAGYGIGERVQAPLTAAGLMMLSYLSEQDQVKFVANYHIKNFTPYTTSDRTELALNIKQPRVQGFAVAELQLDSLYRGIAVPLIDHKGMLHGALSVTSPVLNESLEEAVKRALPILRDTAYSLRNVIN